MASKFLFLFVASLFLAQAFAQHENTKSDRNAHQEENEESIPGRVDIVGAPVEISVNHLDVQKYVKKAHEKLSAQYHGDYLPIVTGVNKATRQLVAGLAYKINLTIGTSSCRKGEEAMNHCVLIENSPIKACEITAYVRSWENFEKINVTCKE